MSRMGDAANTGKQGNEGGQGGQGGAGGANLTEAATQVGQNLRDLGGQARTVATQQYEQLRQQATDYYQQGRDRATEMEQNLEQYVQEKPIQSLLIAAGVGMLLGVLWKRS